MTSFYPDDFHYHFRLTRDQPAEEVRKLIEGLADDPVKKIKSFVLCVTSYELSRVEKTPHTHSYIVTNISKNTFRSRLKKLFLLVGNEDYSLEEVKNPPTMLSYILKDGNYSAHPQFTSIIPFIPDWVYVEEDQTFDKALKILTDQYLNTNLTDYDFAYKLLGLYDQFKKHIYISHIRALWLGVANQRNSALNLNGQHRVEGNARPFRNRLTEEILRGFFIE